MTPDQRHDFLTRAGRALYGDRWKSSLADDLRIDVRTMTRWASGKNEVSQWAIAEVRGLLMARGVVISSLVKDLDAKT